MSKLVRLTAEVRDNFVAYLDGELPEEGSKKIEQALAGSEVARHEIESLARTWELLDELPTANASEGFAQKTMATLTTVEETVRFEDRPIVIKAKHALLVLAWFAGMATVAVAGFLATYALVPQPEDQMVIELPVVENLDRYQEVGDVEFLKRLQGNRTWKMRPQAAGKGGTK